MRALITGATGLIGRALVPHFSSVVVLTRAPAPARDIPGNTVIHGWKPMEEPAPAEAFDGVDVVINLAGASVGEGRWTAARKRVLRDSRIVTTRNLIEGMKLSQTRPRVLISSSAVGYYGNRGDELLDETATPGTDFLAQLCVEWEREALMAKELGVRVVLPRTALVIDRGAPAFQKLARLFRMALAGPLGNGHQWMAWVHLEDLVGLILHTVKNENLAGAINAGAPEVVRNSEFTRQMAEAVGRPAILPAPGFGLRLVLGEFATALLASQRATPRALENSDFTFRYPDLRSALKEALS
jgi:uncharacterized protein (TIGR01777 family)